jgi:hypothetical protein
MKTISSLSLFLIFLMSLFFSCQNHDQKNNENITSNNDSSKNTTITDSFRINTTKTILFKYDEKGGLVEEIEYDTLWYLNPIQTSYCIKNYNLKNELISKSCFDSDNILYREFTYINNRLLEEHDFKKNEYTDYLYDDFGNLLKISKGESLSELQLLELHEYDSLNRIINISHFNENGEIIKGYYEKYDYVGDTSFVTNYFNGRPNHIQKFLNNQIVYEWMNPGYECIGCDIMKIKIYGEDGVSDTTKIYDHTCGVCNDWVNTTTIIQDYNQERKVISKVINTHYKVCRGGNCNKRLVECNKVIKEVSKYDGIGNRKSMVETTWENGNESVREFNSDYFYNEKSQLLQTRSYFQKQLNTIEYINYNEQNKIIKKRIIDIKL